MRSRGWAALQAGGPMQPFAFERREPGARDVVLEITHCGVCHSDLHMVRDDWKVARFPVVPGHEIVGTVTAIGSEVTRFAVGDTAGIGCLIDSCRECPSCSDGQEQYCERRATGTYNDVERQGGLPTYGGYSDSYVVDQDFALKVPPTLDRAGAAPLLCAGITTWSPLKEWGVGPGTTVGVFGLGGLGHLGVKLACALGAHVVVFTTSTSKAAEATRLGAHDVVLSTDREQTKAWRGRLDFGLDTISAPHDLNGELLLLKRDATLCLVGMPEVPAQVSAMVLAGQRRRLTGSNIGGIRETQEMLDFCGERGITADTERIAIADIDAAYERMLRNDVKYRFVIDLATL
jgi:uncharacterized zinc-type alcohol dehydrogenase-like protein